MKYVIAIILILVGFGCAHQQTIDREGVRKSVRNSLGDFKRCYENEYKKDKTVQGKIVLTWEIHEGGVARNVHTNTEKSELRNPQLENCMISVMSSIQFPSPPKNTIAEVAGYPFVFAEVPDDKTETIKN